jgi:helicase
MIIDRELTGLPDGCPLNPMQELVVPYIDSYNNLLIAAPTASGKSTAITMLGKKHVEAGSTIVYMGPMKALVEEKLRTWGDAAHPWSKYRIAIVTGDYNTKGSSKQKDIEDADIVVITPESLSSKMRTGKGDWLDNVGMLVVDEVHLVGEAGRGANLESAIIDFISAYPKAQLLMLSATMPNYRDIAKWIEGISSKKTDVVYSTYRPNKLTHHYLGFPSGAPGLTEAYRIAQIHNIVKDNPDKRVLVAVFKKAFGQSIYKSLHNMGIATEFHYGDLPKHSRSRIEKAFDSGAIRVLVCTKTLAVGVNVKADIVIVTSDSAGGTDIPAAEIQQFAGRAGRFSEGEVYYLIENSKHFDDTVKRLREGEDIQSQMTKHEVLASHFLGAMYRGVIRKLEDFYNWYSLTLAFHQNEISYEDMVNLGRNLISDMLVRGMIALDKETNDIVLTRRGTISAQLMIDPYYVADLVRNFKKLFALSSPSDADLAKALGECSPFFSLYITKAEVSCIPPAIRTKSDDRYWKGSTVYWYRLQGKDVPHVFSATNYQVYSDLPRVQELLVRLATESERWGNVDYIQKMIIRVAKGVNWDMAGLMMGTFKKAERTALNRLGIFSVEDARKNKKLVSTVLDLERMGELGI